MTPAELLDARPVHSINDTARILGLHRRNGDPYRAAVHQLIREGAIRIVDPAVPITRWTVSSAEIRRYVEHGRRTGADIVPLRDVS